MGSQWLKQIVSTTLTLVGGGWTFVPKYLSSDGYALGKSGVHKLPLSSDHFRWSVALDNVLILARDEAVAALLGLMVELQGYSPRFPTRGESPADALASDRFAAVVIDCDHPEWSEDLLRVIRTAAAQPILFSPFRMPPEVVELAARHGAKAFTLPTDPDTFGKMLNA